MNREARHSELAAVARTLAAAFEDDPFWSWVVSATSGRKHRLEIIFGAFVAARRAAGDRLLVDDGLRCCVLWSPPHVSHSSLRATLAMATAMLRGARSGLPRLLRASQCFARERPVRPHAYIELLGTVPAWQGRGIASALLRTTLEQCDVANLGAYLETEAERNVPFYERFGFTVTKRFQIDGGGPPVWLMWREPVPTTGVMAPNARAAPR